jgi:hypothetical protein
VLAALSGCSAPPPALPDGDAPGIVHADPAPPPGATTWARPAWREGDRFELVRGERLRGALVVRPRRRDLDLGNLGEWGPDGQALHVLSPADARYHWPLWVGKRWSCEFVDRAPGRPALPVRADYVVEDLDTVTVPAGTFAALRIVRTLRRLDAPDDFLPRWQVSWYAPDPGIEVRQLVGDNALELAADSRAP